MWLRGCGVAGFRVRRFPPRRAPGAGGASPRFATGKDPRKPASPQSLAISLSLFSAHVGVRHFFFPDVTVLTPTSLRRGTRWSRSTTARRGIAAATLNLSWCYHGMASSPTGVYVNRVIYAGSVQRLAGTDPQVVGGQDDLAEERQQRADERQHGGHKEQDNHRGKLESE
jgi:hypothetical protein